MLGFFSGVVLSVWFRNQGPQKPVYEWLDEEEVVNGGKGEEENIEDDKGKTVQIKDKRQKQNLHPAPFSLRSFSEGGLHPVLFLENM